MTIKSDVDIQKTREAEWSDGAFWGQGKGGNCRLEYMSGLLLAPLTGSCHFIHLSSRFSRCTVRSSFVGGIYAFSEMVGRVEVGREFVFAGRLSVAAVGED